MRCKLRILYVLLLVSVLASCYLRPADTHPWEMQKTPENQMVYKSYADTTYSHDIGFEYRDLLSEQGRMFYDALYHYRPDPDLLYEPNLYHFSPAEEFDTEAFKDAATYIMLDHPEKELQLLTQMNIYYYSESESYVDFGLGSQITIEEYQQKLDEINEKIADLIKAVNDEPIKREKYKLIHDWIIYRVKYDYASYYAVVNNQAISTLTPDVRNLYGAIINELAVCDGISDAFKYICNQCHLECVTVAGEFPDRKDADGRTFGHQWNLVYDDNQWLLLDCTFDLDLENPYQYFMVDQDIDSRIVWNNIDCLLQK